jgi:hypothetical protein
VEFLGELGSKREKVPLVRSAAVNQDGGGRIRLDGSRPTPMNERQILGIHRRDTIAATKSRR